MFIFGIILIVLAGVLAFFSQKNKQRVYALRTVERRNCGDVVQMANEIKAEMAEFGGAEGAFSQACELVGQVSCERPLTSPLGERPCVHYTVTVTRRYEERYWDSNANTHKTRSGTETVSSNKETAPFKVRDASGELAVDAQGAKFDGLVQTVDRFEPSQGFLPQLRIGGFSLNLPTQYHDSGDRRTVGYSYKEQILPLDATLTVIGEVNDKMGQLAMRSGKEQTLTISTRSREELVESARKAAVGLFIGSMVCGLAGLGLIVAEALG